jgi:tRNA G10  N-methylase Trm11
VCGGFGVTEHGLLQLRIHFVCDGHNIQQNLAEINPDKIILESVKDADRLPIRRRTVDGVMIW